MNFSLPIILASNSPRRQQLLSAIGLKYRVLAAEIDETTPPGYPSHQVPEYLAEKKAAAVACEHTNSLIIAADTVVIHDNNILGKPDNSQQAKRFLKQLSGKSHQVITGVCIRYREKISLFRDTTLVTFGNLTDKEIEYYINNYQPMDKAGAYGIQEWIGMTGISRIEGSYFNVVGLPVYMLYQELKQFQGSLDEE